LVYDDALYKSTFILLLLTEYSLVLYRFLVTHAACITNLLETSVQAQDTNQNVDFSQFLESTGVRGTVRKDAIVLTLDELVESDKRP